MPLAMMIVIIGLILISTKKTARAVIMPPTKSTRPCAQKVADALHVAHDARYQVARAVGIIKPNWQPADVILHLFPQISDQLLRGY